MTPIKTGVHSLIDRFSLGDHVDALRDIGMEAESLIGEVTVLRAFVLDLVESLEETQEVMLEWHSVHGDFRKEADQLYRDLFRSDHPVEFKVRLDRLREHYDAVKAARPPRGIPDYSMLSDIIDKIRRIVIDVQKLEEKKRRNSLEIDRVNEIHQEMAKVVARYIRDRDVLESIAGRWREIRGNVKELAN